MYEKKIPQEVNPLSFEKFLTTPLQLRIELITENKLEEMLLVSDFLIFNKVPINAL